MKKLFSLTLLVLTASLVWSQSPKKPTSGEIYNQIQKLKFLGSVLYVAAHPDDENTRMISYFSNKVKAHTTYLSLTRGDGGQNMIGTEIQELLGVLRTQELLSARRVDGGNQTFSRANDFGYSKHPDETLKIWNKKEVLSDVVWAIRNYRPDIIINRFDHRTPGKTHGHHTSSAMLSDEAFDLTADPKVNPEQLQYTDTWQPQRLFFNTSWWFYGSREKFAEADKSNMLSVDVGVYYPILGKSNTEIAAESRSMHKCQGFGSTGTRGSSVEYLELIKGDLPSDKENIFDGINTTWTRVKGGEEIERLVNNLESNFDFAKPHLSVNTLLQIRDKVENLKDGFWKKIKLQEIKDLIVSCLGIYVEAVSDQEYVTPGDSIELSIEVTNRSDLGLTLKRMYTSDKQIDTTLNTEIEYNTENKWFLDVGLSDETNLTTAYWLTEDHPLGMYEVDDQQLRGKPQTQKDHSVTFEFELLGKPLNIERPIVHKFNDRVEGEQYRPFEVVNPISVSLDQQVYIFSDTQKKTVKVKCKSFKDNVSGSIELMHESGWIIEPSKIDLEIENMGDELEFEFDVQAPDGQVVSALSPRAIIGGISYDKVITQIQYDHIPNQTVIQDAAAKAVKIDIKKAGNRIAYIMGAGDEIPSCLEAIGYTVDELDIKSVTPKSLDKYDACIMGIRAYNVIEELKYKQDELLEYVKNGGTMIVQYNTTRGLKMKDLGPYPIQLSRDRVSVEEAEVRIINPDHPVLSYPNKITAEDFDNWVQERGLYFPDEWDEKYETVFSSNDPEESAKDSPLLIAKYGEGYYIHTSFSWFRELPAGVPGAYRIFANLISIGKQEKP